jgi:2-desacetyl-2-hydroxyethyl bacteriochlorophyllide A dehydrogenase
VKAVVFHDPKHVEFVTDRPEPQRRSDSDVLVKILACGLCGSDMRLMTDPPQMPCEPDTVFGHEIVGHVAIAPPGAGLSPGDLVVVVPNLPCGTCYQCKRGIVNLCENFCHVGTHIDGGLAEEIWIPAAAVHQVPRGLDPYVAALTEPLACVLNGTRKVHWHAGEPVVILGAGPIGLLFLAVAKLSGASPLVVSEPNPARARLALDLGADHVVNPADEGSSQHITSLVGSHGAAVVIDALGTLLPTALELVARGGEIVLFGVNHAAQVTISPSQIVDKDLTIHGVYIHKGTFDLALRLLSQHPDVFAPIITQRISIDEWERARELLMSGAAPGKIIVTVGEA